MENKKGYFEIWQPRWHDKTVLLACSKVQKNAINIVRFTQTKSMNHEYTVDWSDIANCPINSNGKIDCYVVPISKLHMVKSVEGLDPFVLDYGDKK